MPFNTVCNPRPDGNQAATDTQQADQACRIVLERYSSRIIAALYLATRHGLSVTARDRITAEINEALEAHRRAVGSTDIPR